MNRLLTPYGEAKMLCLLISGDHVALGRGMLRVGILILTAGYAWGMDLGYGFNGRGYGFQV